MEDELNSFTNQLVETRKSQNISYYKAALCCGLSWGSYGRIEQGGGVTLKTLLKLSKGLNLNIEIKNGEVFLKE